jgi:hypothetical protein
MEIILLIALYMLPWLIAILRGAFSSAGIFWMTLLLGWTGLFWIFAFIWAFAAEGSSAAKRRAKYMR